MAFNVERKRTYIDFIGALTKVTDATPDNTPDTLLMRDSDGNVAVGNIFAQNMSGGNVLMANITINSGNVTTNAPSLDITESFNNGSQLFDAPLLLDVTNYASAPGSLIADYQVNAATQFGFGVNGCLGVQVANPTSLIHLNSSSSSTPLLTAEQGGVPLIVCNGNLSGTSPNNNFLNLTGTLPETLSAECVGVFHNIMANSGSSDTNARDALKCTLGGTYNASASTRAASFINSCPGTATGFWHAETGGGENTGINCTANGSTAGNNVGLLASANGSTSFNVGVHSFAVGSSDSTYNIGIAALAANANTANIAGFFGLYGSTVPSLGTESAALVADNGPSGNVIFDARANGNTVAKIDGSGNLSVAAVMSSNILSATNSVGVSVLSDVSTGNVNVATSPQSVAGFYSTSAVPTKYLFFFSGSYLNNTGSSNLLVSVSDSAGVLTSVTVSTPTAGLIYPFFVQGVTSVAFTSGAVIANASSTTGTGTVNAGARLSLIPILT